MTPLKRITGILDAALRMPLGLLVVIAMSACTKRVSDDTNRPKISVVNSPTDIVTLGANWLSEEINRKSNGAIQPKVYHSGILSGGKGMAEIEMCQQGAIEIHITSTAYLANLSPKASIVSLPFLFRDMAQVVGLVESKSPALEKINSELNEKNLSIIAWWPRGFRQLTNSRRPVKALDDLRGMKFRVMNNQLFVDNMNALGANPVPMEWGEVYNGLQLKTIDGQENAEDVIFSSKLYEIQPFMTIWDYSTDLEVVLVNHTWWNNLKEAERAMIQESADASVSYQVGLLSKNTDDLRNKIEEEGVQIYYLPQREKADFRRAVKPVWDKYESIFGRDYMKDFLADVEKH